MSDTPLYKSSVETLEFNRRHNRAYTDQELNRRKLEAEPYRLFQILGGAGANATLIGNYHIEWYTLYRKAVEAVGSDDANVIDDWVQQRYNRIMGIEPPELVTAVNSGGDVIGGGIASLLGG